MTRVYIAKSATFLVCDIVLARRCDIKLWDFVMGQLAATIARMSPSLANWAWSKIFPFFRREELWEGDEYRSDREETFTTIFDENRWGSDESVSGDGSTLDQTIILRKVLPDLLRRVGAKTLLDAPCGDFNWMRRMVLPNGVTYVGGEIVQPLVDRLKTTFASDQRDFIKLDIVDDDLPDADIWLCRDVLFHLSNAEIVAVLANFARSDVRFILTTTYPFAEQNRDIRSGGFRFINLMKPPFSLPSPQFQLDDYLAPQPPRKLGLWSREVVAAALSGAA